VIHQLPEVGLRFNAVLIFAVFKFFFTTAAELLGGKQRSCWL
jgi:hypothetical protein